MDWDNPLFVIVIIAMVMVTAIITTWMQMRAKARDRTDRPDSDAAALLGENAALRDQVRRLEERLAVLERIATDPAERTAREIERLRQDS